MYIKRLQLKNFRNYKEANINFARNFNIIYGYNAQGKTNILEAIFLCASGRSHRTSRDVELIRISEKGYQVKAEIEKSGLESSVEISYDRNEKKKVKINEIAQKKIGSLIGHLNAVIFSPEDLLVIKEGPSERRRFLDITISQIKPSYFYDLQQYAKVLAQRNILLKEIEKNRRLADTLEVWNHNLVKTGSRIIKTRQEFINKLSIKAENNHRKLTNGNEKLKLRYIASINIEGLTELDEIEKNFMKTLESLYRKELMKATTLCGPQRDDYDILIDGMSVKLYGSQGQQRTGILSLKLSEIDIMKEDTGEYPVLLLDDVMSELDGKRQEYLFKSLEDVQTFITCTDRNFFNNKLGPGCKFLNVSGGIVVEK